jgi:hypothetical protein
VSDVDQTHPDIVWSKREFANITNDNELDRNIKNTMTALVNTVIDAESAGRKALNNKYGDLQFTNIQVSIGAPWAYTISKIITYERETPFTVTESLVDSLIKTGNEQTLEILKKSELEKNAGLTIMTRATTDITANGYHSLSPIGQQAKEISLTQVSGIAQSLITTAVDDLRAKLFPKIPLERYTAMLIFHSIIKELYPTMTEYCLIDLTYETTEVAIVRGGNLQYSTHNHIGINTLVRNIANRLNTPPGDATTLLNKILEEDSVESLSTKEQTVINSIMAEYQAGLESLFHETGDSLSIPKTLFLHANYLHERFFDNIVGTAAKTATGLTHTVHTVTHDLLLSRYQGESKIQLLKNQIDTGGLMASQFFHKQGV